MYHFLVLNARFAKAAGVDYSAVFTTDIFGISNCEGQVSATFGPGKKLGMAYSLLTHRPEKPLLNLLLSGYLGKIHQMRILNINYKAARADS